MMRFAAFLLTFCAITPAFALHCKNDYAGSAGCAANTTPAGDCTTLGFSKSDVAGCDQYLYCMFDTSYKRCISKSESCPTGYGKTVADCGTSGALGWTLGALDSSGCGRCWVKGCSGLGASSCEHAVCSICWSGDNKIEQIERCDEGYALGISMIDGKQLCIKKPTIDPIEPDNLPTVLYLHVEGTYPDGITAYYSLQDDAGRVPVQDMTLTQVEDNDLMYDVNSMDIQMNVFSRNETTNKCSVFYNIKGFLNPNTKKWTSYNFPSNEIKICARSAMSICFVNEGVCKANTDLKYDAPTGTIKATLKNNVTGETITKTLKVKTDTLHASCPDTCDR